MQLTRLIQSIVAIALSTTGAAYAQAIPRTPDGKVDFQGVWSARWTTPLERPAGVDKLVLTQVEAEKLAADLLGQRMRGNPLSPQASDPDTEGVAVVRGEFRSSQVIDPADGKVPLTEAGAAKRRTIAPQLADNPEERVVNERCLAGYWRAPILLGPEGMYMQVVQTPQAVMLHGEAMSNVRIVEFGPSRRPASIVSWQGEGTARWDSDTLVIETTRFRKDDIARGAPYGFFPITTETKITERFTRVSEDEIVYRYTVDDAAMFTRPWTAELSLRRSSERLYETACHEANYSMFNMLRGARVAEERAKALQ